MTNERRCGSKTQIATGNPDITGEVQCQRESGHDGQHQAEYPDFGITTTLAWSDPWAV